MIAEIETASTSVANSVQALASSGKLNATVASNTFGASAQQAGSSDDSSSSTTYILVAAIVGGVALAVIIVLSVVVCQKKRHESQIAATPSSTSPIAQPSNTYDSSITFANPTYDAGDSYYENHRRNSYLRPGYNEAEA